MRPARIPPAQRPYPEKAQAMLDRILPPGMPVIALFSTLLREPALFQHFVGRGLGEGINLNWRQRETIVYRVTAQSGSEYEWGLHVHSYAEKAGFDAAQLHAIVHGGPDDPCWNDEDRLLIRLCDALHASCDIDEDLWNALSGKFSEDQLIEALLLAGYYRTVAYLTNGLRMPLEDIAARFPPA